MTPNHVSRFQDYLEIEQHIAHMIRRRVPFYEDKVALRDRADGAWESVSWREMLKRGDAIARALLSLGVEPADRIGIFSQNRSAWTLADLAILSVRGVTVPIYATNSQEEAEYIIEDAGIRILFVGDQSQYDKALAICKKSDTLKHIIAFSPNVLLQKGCSSYHLKDLLGLDAMGTFQSELVERLEAALPSDLYTLIYTSGTTGSPKGAMLTHENILAALYGTGAPMPVGETDVSLAFLPLSHVFERSWSWFILSRGAENCYCHDPGLIKDFFAEVRPHYMVSVPRVWEKIYGTIQEGLETASPLKKRLFSWALKTGKAYYTLANKGEKPSVALAMRQRVAHKLVLSKICDAVGGRAKFFHAGGAALNPEINAFFVHAGVRLGVGYGLTEIFPLCVCTPKDIGFGTSGKPIPLVSVRISDEGEIQAQSPSLMVGYWKRHQETRQTLTEDGWFKTGDIGEVTKEGYVRVTDRIKEILITAGGKNISPQTIETAIKEDIYVEQAVAVGDGRPYISALVVPSFPMLESLAENMGLGELSRGELVRHPEIIQLYARRIDEHTQGLGQVEKVKRFTLLPKELTQEAGELTPTSKLKRKSISEKYAGLIESMYAIKKPPTTLPEAKEA